MLTSHQPHYTELTPRTINIYIVSVEAKSAYVADMKEITVNSCMWRQ